VPGTLLFLQKASGVQMERHKKQKKYLHSVRSFGIIALSGSLVKRLRRRPLTAETGVRFPYELLTVYN
jgi:hypothetical protein